MHCRPPDWLCRRPADELTNSGAPRTSSGPRCRQGDPLSGPHCFRSPGYRILLPNQAYDYKVGRPVVFLVSRRRNSRRGCSADSELRTLELFRGSVRMCVRTLCRRTHTWLDGTDGRTDGWARIMSDKPQPGGGDSRKPGRESAERGETQTSWTWDRGVRATVRAVRRGKRRRLAATVILASRWMKCWRRLTVRRRPPAPQPPAPHLSLKHSTSIAWSADFPEDRDWKKPGATHFLISETPHIRNSKFHLITIFLIFLTFILSFWLSDAP